MDVKLCTVLMKYSFSTVHISSFCFLKYNYLDSKEEFNSEGGGGRQAGERMGKSSEVYTLNSEVLHSLASISTEDRIMLDK